jgi:hypothetical protein
MKEKKSNEKNEKYANGKNMEVVKTESGINLATFSD